MILLYIRQTLILINQNSRFLRNTKRKCIKSPCSFQKPPLFTVYDLKRKKSNTLNKRQRTRLFDILRIAENYIFYNPTAHRRASPKPCTHTLFNNKVRYITYLIIILFLYHCARFDPVLLRKKKTNTKSCSFSFGAGDGIRTRDFHLGKVAFYH